MAKSITDNRKKKRVGRPRVDALLIGVRVPPSGVTEIDNWRRQQADLPGRPEAIRRLVKLGRKAKK